MDLTRLFRRTLALTVVAGALVAPASTAVASSPDAPWGAVHTLYDGRSDQTITQATTTTGTTVVVYRTLPHSGRSLARVAVQVSGQPWGTSTPLSPGQVARPTVIAWGKGHLSVVWQSSLGQDTYVFRRSDLQSDGTMGPAQRLVTAPYAYPSYQAAINSAGDLALAWSNGDLHDRVVIVHADGTTTDFPPVPVHHPTQGGVQFIANPKALFLDDAGRVSDLTWGTLDGSDRAIWLMRPDGTGGWADQRVAPLAGGVLGYGYVDEADYASNPRGDLVVSWQQRDPATKEWSSLLRYAPGGGRLGSSSTLGHTYCFIDHPLPCVGLAIASDGTATAAYGADAGGDTMVVDLVHRLPDGTFTDPQQVSEPIWVNVYGGVEVAGNHRGDALVSFVGGTHQRIWSEFTRCLAGVACSTSLERQGNPDWLSPWVTSMGPRAGATVTWSQYYRQGVLTRHLAA